MRGGLAAQPLMEIGRIPDPHDFGLARQEGGDAVEEAEVGIEATVDIVIRQDVHRDDRAPGQVS